MKKLPVFLKWAGGKRRILNELDNYFPKKIENYYEPFLGAGSVFFYIKKKYNPKKCIISDINKDLIDTYIAVRDKPLLLIKYLSELKKKNSKDFFYETRDLFNKKKYRGVKRCAIFIFMNKVCFNGIYRVNSKNEFNVPYGRYNNPEIFNKKTILEASKMLQGVKIKHQDYNKVTSNLIGKNDFIYLDPCYDPIKKTSFTAYTPNKFVPEDRIKLKIFIEKAKLLGCSVVLSNNKLKEVLELYNKKNGYEIFDILVSRPINSKANCRGKIMESIIRCNC